MTQIFLSHSIYDADDFVNDFAKRLRDAGLEVWKAPDSILPGEGWVEAIQRGLSTSTHFVLVMSPDAVKSAWVKFEFENAVVLEKRKRMKIIPVRYKPCSPPLFWENYQAVELKDYYASIQKIANRVRSELPEKSPLSTVRDSGSFNVKAADDQLSDAAITGAKLLSPRPDAPPHKPLFEDDSVAELRSATGDVPIWNKQRHAESGSPSPKRKTKRTRSVADVLPPPFEWCEIPSGQVMIDNVKFPVKPFQMAKYLITHAQF